MQLRKLSILALLACFIIFFTNASAQQTQSYTHPLSDYEIALELFANAKYGSALIIFDRLASDGSSLESTSSKYYAAVCSSRLNHPDATLRLNDFIANNSEDARVNDAHFELGNQLFNDKDYRGATEAFSRVNHADLNSTEQNEYFYKTGYSYFKINNFTKAKQNFGIVKDRESPYTTSANYYYGHIAYMEGNYQSALQHFEKARKDPAYADAINYNIVQINSMQGNYDQVITNGTPLLAGNDNKKTAEIARLVADAYYNKDDFDKANVYFEKYLVNKPNNISRPTNYEIGMTYYKTEQFSKAIPYLQNVANQQDSLAQNAYYYLGGCFIKTGQKQFASAAFNSAWKIKADPLIAEDALFSYAKLAIELSYNPYNEAVRAIQQYLNEYPNSLRKDEAYGYLADLYLVTKNYKDALASIQQIKKRSPRLESAFQHISYYRAVQVFNDNDYPQAISLFRQSLENGDDPALNAPAQYWLGEAQYRMDQFEQSILSYEKFLSMNKASSLSYYNTAYYNIGYCWFKLKDYNKASANFTRFLSGSIPDPKLVGDANLRLGDCNFMKKNFQAAQDFYEKAIRQRVADADYATFQDALCKGVNGSIPQKITILQKMVKDYPRSTYLDDAYYETGLSYLIQNKNTDAINSFQKLTKDFPRSPFVKKSLLKTGLIYFNQDKNQEALLTLKQVARDYPGTPEAADALESIKSIYVEMNQVDEYANFVKQIPLANMSFSEEDSLTYIAAENLFLNGDCAKSAPSLEKYVSKYPEGAFILNANFYKSECYYRTEKYDEALKGYNFVLQQPHSRFTETAALKAARINYLNKNYDAALNDYIILEESSERNNVIEAIAGQMQCNYYIGKYGLSIVSAQKLLASGKVSDNLVLDAHFTIARSAYELKNFDLAKKEFEETVKLSKNEKGAESKLMLAQLQFDSGNYDGAEKTIFALSKDYASYDYFVAKGFILLSDVYMKKGNTFQAKQTLQSVIDNYQGPELGQIAKDKLNTISETDKANPSK